MCCIMFAQREHKYAVQHCHSILFSVLWFMLHCTDIANFNQCVQWCCDEMRWLHSPFLLLIYWYHTTHSLYPINASSHPQPNPPLPSHPIPSLTTTPYFRRVEDRLAHAEALALSESARVTSLEKEARTFEEMIHKRGKIQFAIISSLRLSTMSSYVINLTIMHVSLASLLVWCYRIIISTAIALFIHHLL